MRVVVVGAGAREHALALALGRSADVVVTPGSPGIEGTTPEGHRLTSTEQSPLELEADLFVVGPEAPLVAGLADDLRSRGRRVLGPGRDGAALEGSKAYMKAFAADAGVPTAAFGVFTSLPPALAHLEASAPPYVVKTDGLAAGKGVLVTADLEEAKADVAAKLSGAAFGEAGRCVVLEEGLSGAELSLLVLCDGTRAYPLPLAQDAKRLGDGDQGPNTGGMGAYSPVPGAGPAVVGEIMDRIVEPTLALARRRGIEYRGVLYAGCMLTAGGPKLIEFNVRLGDPEAEVVLPRLDGDIAALFAAAADGALHREPVVGPDAAVCVVLAAAGYPVQPRHGDAIEGVDRACTVPRVSVLHAGTARDPRGVLRTAGGRVLAVTALGTDLAAARAGAYEAVEAIRFPGMQYRSDIAAAADRLVPAPGSGR